MKDTSVVFFTINPSSLILYRLRFVSRFSASVSSVHSVVKLPWYSPAGRLSAVAVKAYTLDGFTTFARPAAEFSPREIQDEID
jgi:hypothetical protein